MPKAPPPPPATAAESRDLLVQIIGAYDDLQAAELTQPQRVDVLEAARSGLHHSIEKAAKATGTKRRR